MMMSKAKVLFFAADPLSVPQPGARPKLRLDDEMRQIREKVRAAEFRDALDFDFRVAARTDDLLQAFNETHPRIVHFSGHGGSQGLILASRDGTTGHPVNAQVLASLFEIFRGEIGVVVLSACYSKPQAEAIAEVVGCAIGTHNAISDEAAITFGASFYRAIAFGRSVQTAFDQARLALRLEHVGEHEYPELIVGKGVDPAELVLVPGGAADRARREVPDDVDAPRSPEIVDRPGKERRVVPSYGAKRVLIALAALGLSSGAVYAFGTSERGPEPEIVPFMSPDPAAALESGISLHAAGNFEDAALQFEYAAEAGNEEAMAFLGTAYLNGEGVETDLQKGIYWIREAIKQRNARAMNALGTAYVRGAGESQSNHLAEHWFRESAEKDFVPAMRNLGRLLVGKGTDSAYAEALPLFRRAAAAGDADAMAGLAGMFAYGWGVPVNADSVRWWYRAAAEAGSAKGILATGWLHERRGDDAAAREWYARGADVGAGDAMNNLGVLFYEGRGGTRSRREAIRWFRRAAEAGSTMARANLAALGED